MDDIHVKRGVFIEKARYYSDKIIRDKEIKKIRREKHYRKWLKDPHNKKGKKIRLLSYKELIKMRKRFLIILLICFSCCSIQTIFLLHSLQEEIGGAIFLGLSLMGFAHMYMTAAIDWSIYRRWGNKKSFLDW